MRERAERIKARLKVRSRVGSGTEVELSVPTKVAYQIQPSNRLLKWFGKLSGRKATASSTEAIKEAKQ